MIKNFHFNMKLNFPHAFFLTGLMAFSAFAQEPKPVVTPSEMSHKEKVSYALGMRSGMESKEAGGTVDATAFAQAVKDVLEGKPTKVQESDIENILNKGRADGLVQQAEKDRGKVSYALGMRLGMQLKNEGADVDTRVIAQGINDVMEGKPAKVQESEMPALFGKAQADGRAKLSAVNKTQGDAFLARNSKEKGVTVLPDGLQYKVLHEGTGAMPKAEDLILVKYRGMMIDGAEFDRNDNYLTTTTGGLQGWQEALHMMKVGSKWRLYIPAEFAYGHRGDDYKHVGPDLTLIYDLELDSIVPPGSSLLGSGRMGHGLGHFTPPPQVIGNDPGAATNNLPPAKNP
jgi:FKBP-type peptidyl-prolyl cis-trans isomerase